MTVRLRLTLAFVAVVLVCGAGLVALTYGLFAGAQPAPAERCRAFVEAALDAPPDGVAGGPVAVPFEGPTDGAGVGCLIGVAVAAPPPGLAAPGALDAVRLRGAIEDEQERDRRRLLLLSVAALAAAALASAGVGWVLAGRLLQPLHAVTAAARRISLEDLHRRIAMGGPRDELRDLADTFDAMLARLEAAAGAQRRFVADASHELRTPLATMRAELEVTLADPAADAAELRRMGEVLRGAVARAEHLVEGLLALASSGSVAGTPLDLAEVAAAAVDGCRAEAAAAGCELRLRATPAPVVGDRVLLERLVAGLVENAVRHGRTGTPVEVAVAVAGGRARLVVAGEGPPMGGVDLEGLVAPFRRGGAARTGTGVGLGLAIARSTARAHGGDLRLAARPAGGLEAVVELPSG